MNPVPQVPSIPTSTYRLQFSQKFRFVDAMPVIRYLADLGIDMIYASPYFTARPGSTHGYDVTNHNEINPEIGTSQEHAALIAHAQANGIGHLLDFVPNHMGVGDSNVWWIDVLLWGRESPYSHYFDINWEPHKLELRGKVLLPVLGDLYGAVLDRGELVLQYRADCGDLVIAYFDKYFPVRVACYAGIFHKLQSVLGKEHKQLHEKLDELLTLLEESGENREQWDVLRKKNRELFADAVALEALNEALNTYRVTADMPERADQLDDLLAQQHYRLAYWRLARDEINYRRFFDINELAGLCMEHLDVFYDTHRLLFQWVQKGIVQGVRIDHVDGLRDPVAYCSLIHHQHLPGERRIYLVVEKILARYETIPRDFEIDGTTGYQFSSFLLGLSVDGRVEDRFSRIYQQFSGLERDFSKISQEAKRLVMRTMLASELTVLATMLERIAAGDRRSVDFTFSVLREALTEVIAGFPVYRTYITAEEPIERDISYISWAVRLAMKNNGRQDEKVYEFLYEVLTLEILKLDRRYDHVQVLDFVQKFQQYTGPVTAKAIEDTSFYRYVRLLSLNEVGSDPSRFGITIHDFHRYCSDRASQWPLALSATATHDHKRGEDVRMRINALTEMPDRWRSALLAFQTYSRRSKALVDAAPAPSANDEYALYQTLLGTWPCEWLDRVPQDAAERERYAIRIEDYMRKFVREAKLRSSWMTPDESYEKATIDFARRLLDPARAGAFQRRFLPLVREAAKIGMFSSLVQLVLKCLAPGVPDFYQGTEYWDLSLVDPDNRGTVDFSERTRVLAEFQERMKHESAGEIVADLLLNWFDGRVKFFVMWRLLQIRRDFRDLVLSNDYRSFKVVGRRSRHILAFGRKDLVVIVPHLMRRLIDDGNRVTINDGAVLMNRPNGSYTDLFTGEIHEVEGGRLRLPKLFRIVPFAILRPTDITAS